YETQHGSADQGQVARFRPQLRVLAGRRQHLGHRRFELRAVGRQLPARRRGMRLFGAGRRRLARRAVAAPVTAVRGGVRSAQFVLKGARMRMSAAVPRAEGRVGEVRARQSRGGSNDGAGEEGKSEQPDAVHARRIGGYRGASERPAAKLDTSPSADVDGRGRARASASLAQVGAQALASARRGMRCGRFIGRGAGGGWVGRCLGRGAGPDGSGAPQRGAGGASSSPFGGPSPASTTSATALTRSSSLRFMRRTPVAARPCWEMPPAPVRWTMPPTLMNTSSWCSRTTSAPASPPLRSVSPIVFTPLAPRLVLRYWPICVRFP